MNSLPQISNSGKGLLAMRFQSVILLLLVCLLTFSMAIPGKQSKLREERRKQKAAASAINQAINDYTFIVRQEPGKATTAYLSAMLSRYVWQTNKQVYLQIITEYNSREMVRKTVCRVATTKTENVRPFYVRASFLFLNHLTFQFFFPGYTG